MARSGERIGAIQQRLAEAADVGAWVEAWRLTVEAEADAAVTLCREWRRYPDRLLAVLRERLSAGADIVAEIRRTRWQKHWPEASDSDSTVIPLTALTAAGRVAAAQRAGQADRKVQRAFLRHLGCRHRVVDAGQIVCSVRDCEASAVATDVVAILAGEGRFLARSPRERAQRSVWVPWTLDNQSGLARLVVELIRDGRGACYPDPTQHLFTPWDVSFRTTVEMAWQWAREGQQELDYDVRWRLEGLSPEKVEGDSAGAALAVAFRAVLDEALVDEGIVIAAALKGDRLRPFSRETVQRKATTLLPSHPDAAKLPDLGALVLVAPPNGVHLRAVLARRPTVHVVPVDTLDAAVTAAGGWRGALRNKIAEEYKQLQILGFDASTDRDYQHLILRQAITSSTDGPSLDAHRVLSSHRRCVILAPPGHGKTTLLRKIARSAIVDGDGFDGYCVPVVVALSSWQRHWQRRGLPLSRYLQWWAKERLGLRTPFLPKHDRWEQWFKEGSVPLLFDGLDEVKLDDSFISDCMKPALETVGNCPLVVTCRDGPYSQYDELRNGTLRDLPELRICTLGPSDQRAMVKRLENVFRGNYADDLVDIIQNTEHLRTLAQSPLLLSILCLVRSVTSRDDPLPSTREQFYAHAIEQILRLHHRDSARSSALRVRDRDWIRILEDTSLLVFLDQGGPGPFPQDTAAKKLLMAMEENKYRKSSLDEAWELLELFEQRGLLRRVAQDSLEFLHPTFLEFLCARALARRIDHSGWWKRSITLGRRSRTSPADVLLESLDDERVFAGWREVVVFLAGLVSDSVFLLDRVRTSHPQTAWHAMNAALATSAPTSDAPQETARRAETLLIASLILADLHELEAAVARASESISLAEVAGRRDIEAVARGWRAVIEADNEINPKYGDYGEIQKAVQLAKGQAPEIVGGVREAEVVMLLRVRGSAIYRRKVHGLPEVPGLSPEAVADRLMQDAIAAMRALPTTEGVEHHLAFGAVHLEGEVFMQHGRWSEAIRSFTEVLRTLDAAYNARGQRGRRSQLDRSRANTIGWLGMAHFSAGETDKGWSFLKRSLEYARDLGNREDVAKCLHFLGEYHLRCAKALDGNKVHAQVAFEALRLALPLREETDHGEREHTEDVLQEVQALVGESTPFDPLRSQFREYALLWGLGGFHSSGDVDLREAAE